MVEDGLHLSGYDVVRLLGSGASGAVWLARERATGEPVALKRLVGVTGIAARDRLRREAALLAGVEHPHVVRLRAVAGDGDAMVLVLDLAAGGSLAALLASRVRLSPGEVVTIAVPLAEALAAAHARGVVHGDVTPANVLFTADGRPVLGDLGVSRLVGAPAGRPHGTAGYLDPSGDLGPAGDVHGLAATCLAALAGQAPYDGMGARRAGPLAAGPLPAVLERALDPDPSLRPSAAELAASVFDAARAEPVRLVTGDPATTACGGAGGGADLAPELPVTHPVARPVGSPGAPGAGAAAPRAARPRAGGRHARAGVPVGRRLARGWRAGLTALLGATGLAMAAVTGIAWAGADSEPPAGVTASTHAAASAAQPAAAASTPASSADPSRPSPPAVEPSNAATPANWAAVLDRLDRARARAFATGDLDLLNRVHAPGSPTLARDRASLAALLRAGLRAEGLRLRLHAVSVVGSQRAGGAPAGPVTLRVEDSMTGYRLVSVDGTVVAERPDRARAAWTVTLRRSPGGWSIAQVLRL